MGLKETEKTTKLVVERMDTSMSTMEQMSFDGINITDRLVTLTSETKEQMPVLKNGTEEERHAAFEIVCDNLDQILKTASQVSNVSHELEKQIVYQRDTTDSIKQIIKLLYERSNKE